MTILRFVGDVFSMLGIFYLILVAGQNLYGMWSVIHDGLVVPNRSVRVFFAVAIVAFVAASAVAVKAMWLSTAWGRP